METQLYDKWKLDGTGKHRPKGVDCPHTLQVRCLAAAAIPSLPRVGARVVAFGTNMAEAKVGEGTFLASSLTALRAVFRPRNNVPLSQTT